MKDRTKRRIFKMAKGRQVEISWHYGFNRYMAQIYVPFEDSGAKEYVGFSDKSVRIAFRDARLRMRLDTDPVFRAVFERINPFGSGFERINPFGSGESILQSLRRVRDKLLMTNANTTPKRLYMNRTMAERFETALSVYKKPGELAGLNPPVIIIDEQLPDNKVIEE